MDAHQPFLDAIFAMPEDPTRRLVYADWLEEHGDERAEFLRLRHQLLTQMDGPKRHLRLQRERELVARCDQEWLVLLERADWKLRYLMLEPTRAHSGLWTLEMQAAISNTLRVLETERGLPLPRSYKAYAHVFSWGEMDKYFRIMVPCATKPDYELGFLNEAVHRSCQPWEGEQAWLQSAFFFCSTIGGEMIIWDTATITDPIAHEYRICWLDRGKDIYRTVNTFPEFIDEICFGEEPELPKVFLPY